MRYARIDAGGMFVEDVFTEAPPTPDLIAELIPPGLHWPRWDGFAWVEGRTATEVAAAEIQWLRGALAAGGVVRIPAGVWTVNPALGGPLLVPSNTTLLLDSQAVIRCHPQTVGSFNMFLLQGVEDVTIEGGSIVGERNEHVGTAGAHGMGIRITKSRNITIRNVRLSDHWGDCIYVGGGPDDVTEDITVSRCTLTNARRMGVTVVHGSNVLIEDCTIAGMNGVFPQAGVDIEPMHAPVRDVTIRGCRFSGSVGAGVYSGEHVENLIVEGSRFDGNSLSAKGGEGLIVRGCMVRDASLTIGESARRVSVTGNMFHRAMLGFNTSHADVTGVAVTGNTFDGAGSTLPAIYQSGAGYAVRALALVGNTFSGYEVPVVRQNSGRFVGATITGNTFTASPTTYAASFMGDRLHIVANTFDLTGVTATQGVILNGTGDFADNVIHAGGVVSRAVEVVPTLNPEGFVVRGNAIRGTGVAEGIRLPAADKVNMCRVIGNDFRAATVPWALSEGHTLAGNETAP